MTIANKQSFKQFKFIAAAAVIAGAMNVSFADNMKSGVPSGWQATGAVGQFFDIGIDPAESSDGHPAVYIASKGAAKDKFAAISQTIDVTAWQGKTVKMSMMAKTQEPSNYGELWLRGTAGMSGRYNSLMTTNIKGTKWDEISLVMIIPKDITQLQFGVGLRNEGKIWLRDIKLTTLAIPAAAARPKRDVIAEHVPQIEPSPAPVNLDFSQ